MLLVLLKELIVDILSRLPVKDFLRFKCVSKSCYALINDPNFVKKHLERSTDSKSEANLSLILMSKYSGNELYPLDFNDDADVDDSHYSSHHPSKPIDPGFLHRIVGSCNGLVCLFDGMSSRFVIWNPYTRNSQKSPSIRIEFRGVHPLYLRFGYECNYGFGFGHDRVSDDYKVISILQVFRNDIYLGTESMVYSLKTNSWTIQSCDFPNDKRVGELGFGTYASNGNALHWVIERNEVVESNRCHQHVIVAFDLGADDNEYHEVQLPDYNFEMRSFNLKVLKGCLCICSSDRRSSSSGSSDLWIKKEYGVKAPWTRLISIAHPDTDPFGDSISFTPLVYSRRGDKVLLTSRNIINHAGKLIWYDLTTKEVTILERPCLSNFHVELVCQKSPVPVNGGGEFRNKRQQR